MIIRYTLRNGIVERQILVSSNRHRPRGEERPARHQSETVLKALYNLECSHNFRSAYSKSTLKYVHEDALARFDQTGQEY